MKNLMWNVFVEDNRKIKVYNVLSKSIIEKIKKAKKKFPNKKDFSEEVRHIMMYHFWSKCEWEIILTSWPTSISVEELNRLREDLKEHVKKYKSVPCRLCPRLDVGEKIDVFKQIEINWDVFIDYLWNNLNS